MIICSHGTVTVAQCRQCQPARHIVEMAACHGPRRLPVGILQPASCCRSYSSSPTTILSPMPVSICRALQGFALLHPQRFWARGSGPSEAYSIAYKECSCQQRCILILEGAFPVKCRMIHAKCQIICKSYQIIIKNYKSASVSKHMPRDALNLSSSGLIIKNYK